MSDSLKPYTSLKESGLPWVGDIPAHWSVKRAKALFNRMQRPVRPEDETVTCFRDGMVTLRKNRRTNGFTESLKEIGYQGVRPGDLVIHAMDAFAGAIGVSDSAGKCTPVYSVCTPRDGANVLYFAYLLREMSRAKYIEALARGIRERSSDFRYSTFAVENLPVPTRQEQDAIARYAKNVDHLTRRYIRAQRRLIALLEEQKQALIQRAVTRGLDPNVRLKPSGVAWLGEIPEHWEATRAKYILKEVDERSTTGEETHLSMSQEFGLIPSSDIEERRLLSTSYVGAKLCRKDDLVLNRLKAHLGVFALAKEPGLVSPDYTVLRAAQPICAHYFEMLLRTPGCRVELRRRVKGIVQGFWRLYTDDFHGIVLPFPPLDEQRHIVQALEAGLRPLDDAIAQAQRQIDLVREYRTRLIADVVTGKLDVRDVALPEIAEDGAEDAPDDADDIEDLDDDALPYDDEELAYATDGYE